MRVPLNVGLWFNTFWSIDLMDGSICIKVREAT